MAHLQTVKSSSIKAKMPSLQNWGVAYTSIFSIRNLVKKQRNSSSEICVQTTVKIDVNIWRCENQRPHNIWPNSTSLVVVRILFYLVVSIRYVCTYTFPSTFATSASIIVQTPNS